MKLTNPMSSQIQSTLQNVVHELHNNQIRGDANWTSLIKERLGELGEKSGFSVSTSGFKGWFEPEWLYDLVWYKENEKHQLTEIGLVVESEWVKNWKSIKYDFEKLLQAKANIKLMICQWIDSDIENLKSTFEESLDAFKLSRENETYIIAILKIKEEIFVFYEM